tara:strand:+ start:449 stop:775 length:327 start_codon:yes stop_codon:yes gene_type:complete
MEMTDREIVEYYGQIWENVEHMTSYINRLREEYLLENQNTRDMKYKHKHIKGLSIELIAPTKKGYKVRQTEMFMPWSDKKLRKPKIKTAFYSDAELKDLFDFDNPITD